MARVHLICRNVQQYSSARSHAEGVLCWHCAEVRKAPVPALSLDMFKATQQVGDVVLCVEGESHEIV